MPPFIVLGKSYRQSWQQKRAYPNRDLLSDIGALISRLAGPGLTGALPNIRLRMTTAPTEPIGVIYEPAFALVVRGAKRTLLGSKVFDYGPGEFLVVPVDLPIIGNVVRATTDEPYLAFILTLQPAAIAALLLESATIVPDVVEPYALKVSAASDELLESILRLLRLLDSPADIAVLGPMLEREILWRLLTGEQGAVVRQIGQANGSLGQLNRAIRWIRGHFAETLRVADLAALAGMSTSTFHRRFNAVTLMSPMQYQKQIRLQEARTRLMASAQNVAAVGFDVGYDSPSQFSREYRRLFGTPPAKDMARLRTLSQEQHILA